jgi:hypothetical protein
MSSNKFVGLLLCKSRIPLTIKFLALVTPLLFNKTRLLKSVELAVPLIV